MHAWMLCRSSPQLAPAAGRAIVDATAAIGWLFFGALRPVRGLCEHHSFWFACPDDYRPPRIFAAIAADRTAPFTHRASCGRTIRITIHHEPSYALASAWELIRSPHDGHSKESRRQMLKWISDRPQSTFRPPGVVLQRHERACRAAGGCPAAA